MFSEDKLVQDADDVPLIIWVPFFQLLQDASLNQPLFIQPFLVPQDLQRDHLVRLVIKSLENLPETPLPDLFLHLIPVRNVVFRITDVLTFIIVKTTIFRAVGCLQRLA